MNPILWPDCGSVNWSDKSWFIASVVAYGVATTYALLLWQRGFRRSDWVVYGLLAAGLVAHTIAMAKRGFSFHRCPVHNLYEATAFVMWSAVAGCLLLGLWSRLRTLCVFAAPVVFAFGVFALMPGMDPLRTPETPETNFTLRWISLHVAFIALAYGAFGLSFGSSMMYLSQVHDLKFNRLRALAALLPPVQQIERVIVRLQAAGIVLLSAGLLVSFIFLKTPDGQNLFVDPKVLWSILVWIAYTASSILYWRADHGGRNLAWGNCGCFVFVLLTFWGVNLLSKLHNP